jgi:hypothetical protein
MGITAIALYEYGSLVVCQCFHFDMCSSYDATEDNEISFKEGDKIVEIEAASEDWWQGKNSQGHVGLFPGKLLGTKSICISLTDNGSSSKFRGSPRAIDKILRFILVVLVEGCDKLPGCFRY